VRNENEHQPQIRATDVHSTDDITTPPKQVYLRELLEHRRYVTREVMQELQLDMVLVFSTREHAEPSQWVLGTPCKSDCHYSYITKDSSGVLEMPWRIPGLRSRLVTDETLIGVGGEDHMNQSLRTLLSDHHVTRVGVIGDAPSSHLKGLTAAIVDLNQRFSAHIRSFESTEYPVGMTKASSLTPLTTNPLTTEDREALSSRVSALQAELVRSDIGAALLYGTNRKGQYARLLTGIPTTSSREIIVVKPASIRIFSLDDGETLENLRAFPIEHNTFPTKQDLHTAVAREVADVSSLGVSKEFPYDDLMQLSAGKPLVDVNDMIETISAVKTHLELSIMRDMARNLATLMEQELAKVHTGMSGTELERALDERIRLCSGTRSFPIGVAADNELRGDKATTLSEPRADQCIHEAVCIDMGIQYAGLLSDATRMGFVGNPPIKFEYERLRQVVESVVTDLKPGSSVGQLLKSIQTYLITYELDHKSLAIPDLGHGIGFDLHEQPFLASKEHLDRVLISGMVVCLEPEVKTPYGKIRVEEMLVLVPGY